MNANLKNSLWRQFGASMDMLSNAINQLPEKEWKESPALFYIAYHSILFLDYYLSCPPENFSAPLPFTITAADQLPAAAIDNIIPDEIFTRLELPGYLQQCRAKCQHLIHGLTEQKMRQPWIN